MRIVPLLFVLFALGSCDPGIQTQVLLHYRSDYLDESTASLVRITLIREGLETLVVERTRTGPDAQASFPLLVPIHPSGGDSARRFHAVAEVFDLSGALVHRRRTIGGFEEGKRLEVVVRLDEVCGALSECEEEQTCVVDRCQAACVLPIETEGRNETPSISCAAFRKRIRLVGFNVATDVVGLPVVVQLADADLMREARADGGNIAFADAATGASLSHELVTYDAEDGSLIAWVGAPDIRPDADTEIFMYFGGASAPVDVGAVWTGFENVWHLDGDDRLARDESPRDIRLESTTPPASVSGAVHRAREFPGGLDEMARAFVLGSPDFDFNVTEDDSFSMSIWAKLRPGDSDRLVSTGSSSAPGFFINARSVARVVDDELRTFDPVGSSDPLLDEWTHLALVVDRGTDRATLYRNGEREPASEMPDISTLGSITVSNISLGGSGGCCFSMATLDEFWIERGAWSQSRARAAFHNQSDPEASIEVGELEPLR